MVISGLLPLRIISKIRNTNPSIDKTEVGGTGRSIHVVHRVESRNGESAFGTSGINAGRVRSCEDTFKRDILVKDKTL
jgi:hypothetical protein